MVKLTLSDVQIANLTILMTIRDSIKRDPVAGCCRFGLRVEHAERLTELSFPQVLTIVAHLGDECLFSPRADILSLLQMPLELTGVLCAVHPAAPVGSGTAASGAPRRDRA